MTEFSLMGFDQISLKLSDLRTHTYSQLSYVFLKLLSFSIYIKPLMNLSSSVVRKKAHFVYYINLSTNIDERPE